MYMYVYLVHSLSRGSTHQSLHDTLYDSDSSSEASEEEEQQDRRPVRHTHNEIYRSITKLSYDIVLYH